MSGSVVFVGSLLYFVLVVVVGIVIVLNLRQPSMAGPMDLPSPDPVLTVIGAALLTLIPFGGGAVYLLARSPKLRGLGLGLCIGGPIISLATVALFFVAANV